MEKYDIIIVGGGVSGMTCAVKLTNKKVLILEANDRIGKKLLSTGNGKCNLININLSKTKYNDSDLSSIFDNVDFYSIEDFYKRLGLTLRYDDEGRGYPLSESANTVLDAYRRAITKNNIEIVTESVVEKIEKSNKGYIVKTQKLEYLTDNVVIATGSNASFGRDSLALFDGFGEVFSFKPSLVPLITKTDGIKGLNGVRVKCRVSLIFDGKNIVEEYGEVLFKTFGISGIAIFNLSSAYARENNKNAYISLNLLDLDKVQTIKVIKEKIALGFVTAEECIDGMFHKMLVQNILNIASISKSKKLDNSDVEKLASVICDYRLKILGLGDKSLAQVMCGGLRSQDINKSTLELKSAKNMFAIGECVDVDGVSGGYNIMWAVASAITVANALNKA